MQFEFPWVLGPEDGRYVLREHAGQAPSHVLVLGALGAPQRRLVRGRRARKVASAQDAAPVSTTRATVIRAQPFADVAAAQSWLSGLELEHEADDALKVLNVALQAHRVASADPYAREVAGEQALVIRAGFGDGEQVADGRFSEAVELTRNQRPRRRRREAALRPQERLARLLGARDTALTCEELALRARSDVEAGRWREAALQTETALRAALADLAEVSGAGMTTRLAELDAALKGLRTAAGAALAGPLPESGHERVEHALERLEAALRARSAGGFER